MIFTYKECLQRCGSKYNMNKMIASGEIFKQEKGIYSDVNMFQNIRLFLQSILRRYFLWIALFTIMG